MPTIRVSTEEKEDRQARKTDTTVTHESFDSYASPPANALQVTRTVVDGKFTTQWTVSQGANTSARETYTIQGGMSQEPLATHPMFKAGGAFPVADSEWKKWKIFEADQSEEAKWKPDGATASDGMKKFYAYFNRGVVDFLLGSCTMRVESESATPSLAGLGRIDTPTGAPGLTDGRTWLLVGIDATPIPDRATTFGPLMRVIREYRASAAGGWDTNIYNKA